jgi:hypothetical protein
MHHTNLTGRAPSTTATTIAVALALAARGDTTPSSSSTSTPGATSALTGIATGDGS